MTGKKNGALSVGLISEKEDAPAVTLTSTESFTIKDALSRKWKANEVYKHPVPVVRYYLTMSSVNIILLIGCVAYMSGNVILLTLLSVNEKCNKVQADNGTMIVDPSGAVHHCPVEEFVFHRLEFTGTFLFNVLNQFIVVYSPEGADRSLKMVLKWIAMINILASFIGMMLVWIDLAVFEIPSHEVEYANSIMMAVFDVLLLSGRGDDDYWAKVEGRVLSILAISISLLQPIIYNEWVPASIATFFGIAMGEKPAHYIEFSFEILSAFVSARVIYDNKIACDFILYNTMWMSEKARQRIGPSPMLKDAYEEPEEDEMDKP